MVDHDLIIAGIPCKLIPDFDGYAVGVDGSIWTRKRSDWRAMRPRKSISGHLGIKFSRDGEKFCFLVHRLVLGCFVGPCPPGMEACHYPDHDPTNNRLENLRWDTVSENRIDSLKDGRLTQAAKLNADDVRKIRRMGEAGIHHQKIADDFGVTRASVYYAIIRRTWGHVL